MEKLYAIFFVVALFLGACSPKITTQVNKNYPALDSQEEVAVLGVSEEIPANAEVLGEVKIGDSGFSTKCRYEDVIGHAKLEARKIGGNVLKLTSHKLPSAMGSSCHRIVAQILKVNAAGVAVLAKQEDARSETSNGYVVPKKDFQRFRIAFNGGYSHLVAKISDQVPSDFRQYTKELKSGYHLGGDATYFFSELYGAGLKYNLFRTSNSINNIYVTDADNNTRYGGMSDDISVNFIAPAFTSRMLSKNGNNAFLVSIAIGYISYYNNAVIIDPLKITGSTLGTSLDVGYDIRLSKKLSFGLQASYLAGKLTKITYDNGVTKQTRKLENDQAESLNRIDISAGLRLGL